MDALGKIFDEFRSRIRSPIWGTIGLYVILLNWKAFYFLLFADVSVPEKFSFWDENVTHEWLIYYPLILGVAWVVTVPWIRLGFTWVNRSADLKLHRLQTTQKNDKKIHDLETETKLQDALAKEEAVREQQKIDRAKRLQEAGEVGGEDLINEIRFSRGTINDPEFTEVEKWLINLLVEEELTTVQIVDYANEERGVWYSFDKTEGVLYLLPDQLKIRDRISLTNTLATLTSKGVLSEVTNGWSVEILAAIIWADQLKGSEILEPNWTQSEVGGGNTSD